MGFSHQKICLGIYMPKALPGQLMWIPGGEVRFYGVSKINWDKNIHQGINLHQSWSLMDSADHFIGSDCLRAAIQSHLRLRNMSNLFWKFFFSMKDGTIDRANAFRVVQKELNTLIVEIKEEFGSCDLEKFYLTPMETINHFVPIQSICSPHIAITKSNQPRCL